jgi:beta-glucosidase
MHEKLRSAALALLIGCAAATATAASASADAGPCADPAGRAWCDASRSADERAGLLLGALTQDEKLSLLAGDQNANGHTGATPAIPRLGIPQSYNTDGPVGVRQGQATAMPAPMALGATFDPGLARLYGAVLGNEARAKGNDGLLGPTINIMRTPLNGRTFEAFGEDPFLVARTAAAWVRGAQAEGVYATPKHFAANNQEGVDETGKLGSPGAGGVGLGQVNTRYEKNSVVDERTLREIYLPQFEAAVAVGAGSVMCSYNRLNGPWACADDTLLDQILKREWGFRGFVMSDWVFATHPWDTAHSLNAGLDVEMPFADQYNPLLVKLALAGAQAGQGEVDDHVRRLLRTLFAVGFFDRPTSAPDDGAIDQAAHAAAARRVEESAITLLQNRGGILPLGKPRSIAVIGAYANKFVTGGGSGGVTPFSTVTGPAGIQARAHGATVTYADGSDAAAAAAAARRADVAIVFAGDYQTEGADRRCLSLECPDQGDQDGLIAQVAAAQPNTVVVLETGGPVLTPWRARVKGLVEAWYPGEAGGTAIARVLFGDADPGGRLPATFPDRESDEQVAGDTSRYPGDPTGDVHYSEGVLNGYRWFDAERERPAFAFGAGRSYTTFAYRRLRATARSVSFDVVNTGRRRGVAVPQLYLGLPQPDAQTVQPPKQLKGYAKLTLAAGARRRVTFPLDRRALSYWNTAAHGWAVAPGCYCVLAGSSSRRLPLRATVCPRAARRSRR